jgi:hypothetical protein
MTFCGRSRTDFTQTVTYFRFARAKAETRSFSGEKGFALPGVDGSEVGLKKAPRLAEKRGVAIEAQVVDLSEYEIEPEKWDAIVMNFRHLPGELRQKRSTKKSLPALRKEES